MKHITFNRAAIAFVLIYFPIATLGATGSYWRAVQALLFLVAVMVIGAVEEADYIKRNQPSNACGQPTAQK